MTELVKLVQQHDVTSPLIELFEIDFNGGLYYFSGSVDTSPDTIGFDGNTYYAMPIELTGVEVSSTGASNRPTLTIANVLNTFSAAIGNVKNDDLVGVKVTKRTTLYKYLDGQSPAAATVEFPKKIYYIDRIDSEDKLFVSFELASPYDLSNITLPTRILAGKYCSWPYQGLQLNNSGGCTWPTNSVVPGTSTAVYFTKDDIPIISDTSPHTTPSGVAGTDYYVYSTWSGSGTAGNYYLYSNTVWKCLNGTNTAPSFSSRDWQRADVCGKKLSSCKCRFQFDDYDNKKTNKPLPFGAFPGSNKFR